MKQKIIKSVAVIVLSLLPIFSSAHDFEVNGIYYNITSSTDNTVDVTYKGDNYFSKVYSGTVMVPSTVSYDGIEYSVTGLGNYAFLSCSSLVSIELPSSLLKIKDQAFGNCNSLNSIVIPNSVTNIGAAAFSGCTSLSLIEIPSNVETLMANTFRDCTSLSSVIIPNSITGIEVGVFGGCTSLITVTIPNSVKFIDNGAFGSCSNLKEVTIGDSMNKIYDMAFWGCSSLKKVYCYAENPPTAQLYSEAPFDDRYIQNATLYVPKNSEEEYKNNKIWKNFGVIRPIGTEDLIDATPYENINEISCSELTYTRNFINTNWNALYVPFSMSYNDWNADFEVARLNDVHQFDDDEDGDIDRTVLETVKLKDGSTIEPNTPYMIKAKAAGEKTITLTDVSLHATEENSFDVTSWFTKFTFTGTYRTITNMATKGYYALVNGGLMQAASDAATLDAFRWYLDITDRNGNPAPVKGSRVLLSFDDGETTEINVVEAYPNNNIDAIYSISGVDAGHNKSRLPKGLYISNGKKFLVK